MRDTVNIVMRWFETTYASQKQWAVAEDSDPALQAAIGGSVTLTVHQQRY